MEAEDVLQASYLKILDGSAVFRGRSSFRTWLFGVIRRTAAEHHRRSRLSLFGPLAWLNGRPEGRDEGADPEAATVEAESSQRLRRALGFLSKRQAAVLHLVFYQGLSIEEASQVLGVSVGTARTHYERAKERLRRQLAEAHVDG